MAKLDGLFGKHGDNVLYAPTFDKELTADSIIGESIEKIVGSNNLIVRRHPAYVTSGKSLKDSFTETNIVVSGYSSMGMEAIVLDKPTILVNNPNRFKHKSFPPKDYVCNQARSAAIQINNPKELKKAIETYKKNPSYLRKERRHYGNLLCEYRGVASERTVDLLEDIYESRGNKKN